MTSRFIRVLGCALALVSLAACAVTEARRIEAREALAQRIADNAIAYNEAYSSAIAGQMLLNVLRAHDRQPRQYMSMSGFTNSAPDSRQATLGIASLPLGDLGQEWGEGSLSVQRTVQGEPEFKVEPFSAESYSNITAQPTSNAVFRNYWDTGWNRDLLLLLLVDTIDVRNSRGARTDLFRNSAATIVDNCVDASVGWGCRFVTKVRELVNSLDDRRLVASALSSPHSCLPIAIYDLPSNAPQRRRRGARVAGSNADPCPVTIVHGDDTYVLTLRSLDDIVYYLGELLRTDGERPPDSAMETRLTVLAPSSAGQAPLFRIEPATPDTIRRYSATVTYMGDRYSAGPLEHRFCRRGQSCAGPPGDRTSTVLELLIGILAHNQSEAAVSAPEDDD